MSREMTTVSWNTRWLMVKDPLVLMSITASHILLEAHSFRNPKNLLRLDRSNTIMTAFSSMTICLLWATSLPRNGDGIDAYGSWRGVFCAANPWKVAPWQGNLTSARATDRPKLISLDRKHLKTHVRPYGCDKCLLETAEQSDMRKHLETHQPSEERPRFFCTECPVDFTRYDNLLRHKETKHSAAHSDVAGP